MRFGNWRGATLALAFVCALAASTACRADLFHHTIPDLVPAVDVNTGGPYLAPPIPYGHYTGKNCAGKVGGLLHGGGLLGGLLHKGACANCGGAGCALCGKGGGGGGHFHHGGGGGGFGHGHGGGYGETVCGSGCGHGLGHSGLHQHGNSECLGHASTITPCEQGMPSTQTVVIPSSQCVDPGCGVLAKHRHRGCGLCSGKGCHRCLISDPCSGCGGRGCGLCRGNGTGCLLCGGKGCAVCAKAKGLVNSLLHKGDIKWFVGPGGPVPLTPGYTPYVVTTRSPRDFLAFPPFVP